MNLKMQMRPRRAAGVADVGNDLPGFDLLACGDADARAVRVQCRQWRERGSAFDKTSGSGAKVRCCGLIAGVNTVQQQQ